MTAIEVTRIVLSVLGIVILAFSIANWHEYREDVAALRRLGDLNGHKQILKISGTSALLDLCIGFMLSGILFSVFSVLSPEVTATVNRTLFLGAIGLKAIRVVYVRLGRRQLLYRIRDDIIAEGRSNEGTS